MKHPIYFSLAILLAALRPALAQTNRAAPAGAEVIIVYNTKVPESKGIAEYYAQRRGVPADQIFGFELSTNEDISRVEFRETLQKPLDDKLQSKKLWRVGSRFVEAGTNHTKQVEWRVMQSRIRYAVLCYGVPLRIMPDPNLKEAAAEKMRPELRRDGAAVDSELALLPLLEQKLPLTGPVPNLLYTVTNSARLHPTNGVLMVSRLDGPSPAIARGLVDKALEAEADGLHGRAYFDVRNVPEPGLKLGDNWIRFGAEIWRRMGFETVVDENPTTFPPAFPMDHIACYMGWYDQNVSGPFTLPRVEFAPGAFAYHLFSYSAASVRTADRFWVGPLLAKGATVTMGCVDEPYLGGTPDLGVFTERFLPEGYTFGEAAYASQPLLSWQTTVVGDPLYRPFGRTHTDIHQQLLDTKNKLAEWSWLRLVNLNLVVGKPLDEVVREMENLDATKQSVVLTEKLGNLYDAQGKPASAVQAWQHALELDPSFQQRVRLHLSLAQKLQKLDREPEAYVQYQLLMKEYPDYPAPLDIYHHLQPMAVKLNHPEDAKRYQAEIDRLTPPPPPPAPPAGAPANSDSNGKSDRSKDKKPK